MKKSFCAALFFFCASIAFTNFASADVYPVVVSVSEYKITAGKYDEVSDPDVYLSIIYNGEKIETSKPIRDNVFHSFGEMKAFGDYCQGIKELKLGDKLIIKFYDLDYSSESTDFFWEWIEKSSYKRMAYFRKQLELMNDKDKLYDDFDAYTTAKDDPEIKKIENDITNYVMEINKRKNNKEETEYIGEITIDIEDVAKSFKAGEEQYAKDYEIKNPDQEEAIGKVNIVIKRFDGFGSSIKIKTF